jgi:hypothetical protein
MKLRPLLTLCAALLALSPGHATAQTSAVPGFISYQGRVVDASGNNVGAGTPVNRTVIFRIWDTPSATTDDNLIYSEAQTVTISEGEFSVLVGQGVTNTTQTYGYPEGDKKLSDLGNAFNGSARYLGVTVAAAATIATTDNEITPRQQIVSTAFAMRAKVAESVYANAISSTMLATGAVGSTQLAGASVTSDKLGVAAVLTGNLGDLSVKTAKIDNLAVTTVKIDGNAVDNTKLRDSVGLSVIGRTSNTTGDPADIIAATDGHVLRRSGTSVGFGTVGTAGIANAAITGEKIASDTAITAVQLTATNRVMTASLEFWPPPAGTFGALFKAGSPGLFPTNTSATAGDMVLLGSPRLHLATANGGAAVMTLSGSNVGIGTTTPTQAKLVVLGSVSGNAAGDSGFYVNDSGINGRIIKTIQGTYTTSIGLTLLSGTFTGQTPAARPNTSIYADGAIWSGANIVSSSDARIKNIQGRSDSSRDLDTLVQIEVTDYRYKDVIGKGNFTQKKVIAQQVEKVYPQAVNHQTDSVPDIYKTAPTKDGWVKLATDLKKGERVKLITGKDEGSVHEVLEVTKDKFLTGFRPEGDQVFVYGREVNDFRTVDYDAIAMLNVSATQQLKREKDAEIQTLRDENAALRRELAAKDASLEARLIALEGRMFRRGATETVSLKTAKAAE